MLSKPMRVNSANAMVRSEKYTPSMPKRKPSQAMTAPNAIATAMAANTPSHGPTPNSSQNSAAT